eukprot:12544111-Prorocentrum_lima.AAC.1
MGLDGARAEAKRLMDQAIDVCALHALKNCERLIASHRFLPPHVASTESLFVRRRSGAAARHRAIYRREEELGCP